MNRFDLNKRELKVDFASDNKNGTNLRPNDVQHRDLSENESIFGHLNTANSTIGVNPSNPTNTVDTLNNLTLKHQVMLIYGIKGMYEDLLKKKDYKAIEEMKNALAFTGPDGINPISDSNSGVS